MAKSFGPSKEQQLRKQAEQEVKILWQLIEADFATLKRECKIDHPCKMQTLERIRQELSDLELTYLALENTAE